MKMNLSENFYIDHPSIGRIHVYDKIDGDCSVPWKHLITDPGEICTRIVTCEVQAFYISIMKYVDQNSDIKSVSISGHDEASPSSQIKVEFSRAKDSLMVKDHWDVEHIKKLSPGFITRFNNMQIAARRAKFVSSFSVRDMYTSMRNMFGDEWVDGYLDSTIGMKPSTAIFYIQSGNHRIAIPFNVFDDIHESWMGQSLSFDLTERLIKCSSMASMNKFKKVLDVADSYAIKVNERLGKLSVGLVEYVSGEWESPATTCEKYEKFKKLLSSGNNQYTYAVLQKMFKASKGRPITKSNFNAISDEVIGAF